MSMMPNTSVRPAASKNSMSPSCRPFRACSSNKIPIVSNQPCGLERRHLAVAHVGVGVVLEHGAQRAVGDAALAVLGDHAQVVVLDGEVVAVELEGTAAGVELGR